MQGFFVGVDTRVDEYRLIDCGCGRRLEQFGKIVCERPAPVANWSRKLPEELWAGADLLFTGKPGAWVGDVPAEWEVDIVGVRFSLEPAGNGQVGVFPEQRENWSWIRKKTEEAGQKLNVLNVFAHTGGSTIAALQAGAEVSHVDAARSANIRARRNAALSGCAEAVCHWITEDAVKFMQREVRRGKRYDAIILDPPAFGRMKKKIWKFEKDMPELLQLAAELLSDRAAFFLLTAHNTGWNSADLFHFVQKVAPKLLTGEVTRGSMDIAGAGNSLPLGMSLRVEYQG